SGGRWPFAGIVGAPREALWLPSGFGRPSLMSKAVDSLASIMEDRREDSRLLHRSKEAPLTRRCYVYRLRPTAPQVVALERYLRVTRAVYNAALEQRIQAYRQSG